MDVAGTNAWRRLGLAGALCLIAALGESREPGVAAIASTRLQADPAQPVQATPAVGPVVAFESDGAAQIGADEDDGAAVSADAVDSSDEARLIPAIYAWDPDVRFIFFRHMSKWM